MFESAVLSWLITSEDYRITVPLSHKRLGVDTTFLPVPGLRLNHTSFIDESDVLNDLSLIPNNEKFNFEQ